MKKISFLFGLLVLVSCSNKQVKLDGSDDPNLWLEQVEGEKSLSWVNEQNEKTLSKFTKTKRYKKINEQALAILQAEDKIPYVRIAGDYLYNFWQDNKNVRGIIRRTNFKSYLSGKTKWETVLDVDVLSKKEKENWVYKGMNCLYPGYELCLVELSRGGKDAVVIREFNTKKKSFVKNGFYIKEAKTWVDWKDRNHLLVSTDFGSETLTESGYPRQTRVWARNTKLDKSPVVLNIDRKHMGSSGNTYHDGGQDMYILKDWKTFFSSKHYVLKGLEKHPIPVPETSDLVGLINGHFIIQLRHDWKIDGSTFKSGSLFAVSKKVLDSSKVQKEDVKLLYQPNESSSLLSVSIIKGAILVNVLEDVRGQVYEIKKKGSGFDKAYKLPTKVKGDLKLVSTNDQSSDFFFQSADFLTPSTLYYWNSKIKKERIARQLPAKFKSSGMTSKQMWAVSKDGTRVPYWLVGAKAALKKGKAPTLLYGYGGFTVSLTPRYSSLVGKLWLEKGGVYVVANIRGGGEFGPKWHQAALMKNRHKAYEDFIAVAESLIEKGITTKDKLAIEGGSNGGLLVGAVMTKRPDLFKAVVCKVPLLDMIRFSQLLAGASWVGEYGDPRQSDMRDYLLSYSPYHNVEKEVDYPEVFFMTSTKDDRVHPGHARKMVARMKKQGHPDIYYYENTEGGHAGSANLKQTARMTALTYEFLFDTIAK